MLADLYSHIWVLLGVEADVIYWIPILHAVVKLSNL